MGTVAGGSFQDSKSLGSLLLIIVWSGRQLARSARARHGLVRAGGRFLDKLWRWIPRGRIDDRLWQRLEAHGDLFWAGGVNEDARLVEAGRPDDDAARRVIGGREHHVRRASAQPGAVGHHLRSHGLRRETDDDRKGRSLGHRQWVRRGGLRAVERQPREEVNNDEDLSRNLTVQALHRLPTRPLPGKSEQTAHGSNLELCRALLTKTAVPPMVPSLLRPVGTAGVVCATKFAKWASAMPTNSAEQEA